MKTILVSGSINGETIKALYDLKTVQTYQARWLVCVLSQLSKNYNIEYGSSNQVDYLFIFISNPLSKSGIILENIKSYTNVPVIIIGLNIYKSDSSIIELVTKSIGSSGYIVSNNARTTQILIGSGVDNQCILEFEPIQTNTQFNIENLINGTDKEIINAANTLSNFLEFPLIKKFLAQPTYSKILRSIGIEFSGIDIPDTTNPNLIVNRTWINKTNIYNGNINLLENFNPVIYKELNPDLASYNNYDASKHYVTHGIKENRHVNISDEDIPSILDMIPDDFDPESYKELNPDLSGMDTLQLKPHYISHGIREGRKYKVDISVNLPDDFDPESYKELNPDLSEMSTLQLKSHYISHGMREERKYKVDIPINLPDDFDPESYKRLNLDLSEMDTMQLKTHYIIYGIQEGRKYKAENLPGDFNSRLYKVLNPDLKSLSDLDASNHYATYGINEGRAYKCDIPAHIDINSDDFSIISLLPEKFMYEHYRIINPDLKTLSDYDLAMHYISHGHAEKRKYYIKDIDKSSKYSSKNAQVIFINHEPTLTGAAIFLYDLVIYLEENKIFDMIQIVDAYYSEEIDKMYFSRLKSRPIFYLNDTHSLLQIISEIEPIFIYSNSVTMMVRELSSYEEHIYKTFFHFHESYENLVPLLKDTKDYLSDAKIYVCAQEISNQLSPWIPNDSIQIFTGFYAPDKLDEIMRKYNEELDLLNMDPKLLSMLTNGKITFCMCGSWIMRKGYDIFLEIGRTNPNYNFIWIGGSVNIEPTDNFFHIPTTENPHKYFKYIDYMLITSRDDPCPLIIFETLYIGIPCIVLDKNVKYTHNIPGLYHSIPNHLNNPEIISNYINSMDLTKGTRYQELTQYILSNFSSPSILKPSKSKPSTVLIASLLISTEEQFSYWKNIINYTRLVYSMNLDVILVVNTMGSYNGNFVYNQEQSMGKSVIRFGLDQDVKFNLTYLDLPHTELILVPNKGADIGPFMVGLNYIKSMGYKYVVKLHSKSNKLWRDELFKICSYPIDKLNVDTISSEHWTRPWDSTDLNNQTILNGELAQLISGVPKLPCRYNVGSAYATRFENLWWFIDNFEKLYPILTDSKKDDTYWIHCMNNHEIFTEYYEKYKNNCYNTPIDMESFSIIKNNMAKNCYELWEKYKLKGIPDLQIEHALERYTGWLTMEGKNIKLV